MNKTVDEIVTLLKDTGLRPSSIVEMIKTRYYSHEFAWKLEDLGVLIHGTLDLTDKGIAVLNKLEGKE